MNSLEKLKALLNKENRNIKIGSLVNETTFPFITIEVGNSEETEHSIKDSKAIYKPVFAISVFSQDYNLGFNLLETLINEIKNSEKQSMFILHVKTFESTYDVEKNLYKFKALFKEIKLN